MYDHLGEVDSIKGLFGTLNGLIDSSLFMEGQNNRTPPNWYQANPSPDKYPAR